MGYCDRTGNPVPGDDSHNALPEFLYGTAPGRLLVKLMIRPAVSRAAGALLDSRLSAAAVEPFRKKNGIDMTDFEERRFRSFNDFFTRQLKPGRRPADPDLKALIAPCDSKVSVYPIHKDLTLAVKGVDYSLPALLKDNALADRFRGGWAMVLRLTVRDYHRYCFPADGTLSAETRIPGVFHTVNPAAACRRTIYRENTREYALLETERFGTILQMEVGACMVGRIVNEPGERTVRRGDEKGRFEFGGSTVILLLQGDRVRPDEDLLRNTARGDETVIHLGERIGQCMPKGEEP